MHRNLDRLISRHTTQWFHRVNMDELSPAISLNEISTRLLEFMEARKLGLTVTQGEFRRNLCEFLCTYYIANKRGTTWRGPLSQAPRPRGWTSQHEQQWEDYLRFEHFSADFWSAFWDYTPEALWESRSPGWRDNLEHVVLHYIVVQPGKIDLYLDRSSDCEESSEGEA